MNDQAGDSKTRRHTLSDWLALHELDPVTCRRILDAVGCPAVAELAQNENSECHTVEVEVVWLRALDAMLDFLPEQQSVINDTFEKTAKILVDPGDESGKSFTLDNGAGAYPTIVYNYRGEPSDCLVIAHEFAHALQIRASRGKFVPPVLRETCAFLGEGALLSHTRVRNPTKYAHLVPAWQKANHRYFGAQRDRLKMDLPKADTPYRYSWNYPVARYLAIQISQRCSPDWIWTVFQGELSLKEILGELNFPEC
jgi:hypothetical protein